VAHQTLREKPEAHELQTNRKTDQRGAGKGRMPGEKNVRRTLHNSSFGAGECAGT
jgi:hypothetical protein